MNRIVVVLYALFLVGFTIFSYSFTDANLVYIRPFLPSFLQVTPLLQSIIFSCCIVIFFVFYSFALLKAKKELIIRMIVVSLVALFLSYPAMLSHDIFNYITTAKVAFHYQENPYIIMPIEFVGDPLLLFMHAANKTALYGPAWILLSGIPFFLGMGNFLLMMFSFKLFVLIFYIGLVVLLYRMTKNWSAVAFFALNPLVVIETIVSSHNDVVMMFFAVLSFYLLMKKKNWSSLVFLALSLLIKYATFFLLPVYIYAFWKGWTSKKVSWPKVFLYCAVAMTLIFLLSPLREEMYPWYVIWILPFVTLLFDKKLLVILTISLSFGLLLRYLPFMYTLTHFGDTPILKIFLTVAPPILVFLSYLLKDKLWSKGIFRS